MNNLRNKAASTSQHGKRAKPVADFVAKVMAEYSGDGVPRMAAALAYYATFSLAPLLVIGISVIGLVLGRDSAQGQVMSQVESAVGHDSAIMIQGMLGKNSSAAADIIGTVIGALTLILGASGVLMELQNDLNTMWDVKPALRIGIGGLVFAQLQPLVMVLTVGAVMMASVAASTVLGALSETLRQLAPWLGIVSAVIDVLATLASTTFTFALAFKYLTGLRLTWRDVWIGGLFTSVLFSMGKYAISWYLSRTGAGSAFGAAGSLVVLLLFVFYASQIFLLGAEFTQVWARTHGSRQSEGILLESPQARRGTIESDKTNLQSMITSHATRGQRH